MDNALRMTGMALRAGRLEAGEDPAGGACRGMRCRLLLTASDAAGGTLRRAERFAEEGACLLLRLPYTKAELGEALGRGSCAIAAITDLGLARAVAEKLAQKDAAQYGEIAERLRLKAERAAQRREKTAKDRQNRMGRQRPSVQNKKK